MTTTTTNESRSKQLNAQVTPSFLADVDRVRDEKRWSRAEAARYLIERGLAEYERDREQEAA